MDPHLQSEEMSQRLAEVCGVLAHPRRLQILNRLARRPQTASDLEGALKFPHAEIIDHLQALSRCGLVLEKDLRPDGTYALAHQCTIEALSLLQAVGREAADRRSSA